MVSAKDIRVAPITAANAVKVIRKFHYSGKVVQNSQLHFGVFLGKRLLGAMQFGPSMQKSGMIGLVKGTSWNGFLELNLMAFSGELPRFSESRAIAVAFRLIKKHYPHVKWVVSFADGTQCGDGTIYRASGFELIGIKKNTTLLRLPDGRVVADISLNVMLPEGKDAGAWKRAGAKPLPGFQLKYIKFVDQTWRSKLSVKTLPFSAIKEAGAAMYKGLCVGSETSDTSVVQTEKGGATPTSALHIKAPSIKAERETGG